MVVGVGGGAAVRRAYSLVGYVAWCGTGVAHVTNVVVAEKGSEDQWQKRRRQNLEINNSFLQQKA